MLAKIFNPRGDLFATTFTFGLQAVIRLFSSLVLTRVLLPEAYGIITILLSILYVVSNIVDTNVVLFVVRDKNAEVPRYINTAWTMKFLRSILSGLVVFFAAPLIATKVYGLPDLSLPIRVFSLWFFIDGIESMAFSLAIRRKQARVQMYSELATSALTTAFSIAYCYRYHTFWGILFALLLGRVMMTIISYQFYKDMRPRFAIDIAAAKEILAFSKFTVPSSFLTLSLNQFDKVIFLRLFSLEFLGLYGLATNIAGSIEAVIVKISSSVLYPRCAHNFRTDPETATVRYYTENIKLFIAILAMPAAICGAAHFIVTLLYDSRYSAAGGVLQALAIRGVLLSFACPAEDLLISTGKFHIILVGNILRTAWVVCGSLLGYYFFGFLGFVYGISLSGLAPLVYYLSVQHAQKMLIVRYELYKLAFCIGVGVSSYFGSAFFSALFPNFRIR